MSLVNTINLSFDMTKVLTEMEVHGIKINVDTLHQLRDEYQIEMLILNKKLDTMVKEARNGNIPDEDETSITQIVIKRLNLE